jgi:hypothetical protein
MLIMAVHQVPSLTRRNTRKSFAGSRTARAAWSRHSTSLSRASWFTLPDSARTASALSTYLRSEEAVARVRAAISPIVHEVGIEEPPEFFPAHTFAVR